MPQTPLEQGGTWATSAEEADYLTAVAGEHPQVSVETSAITVGGRPIHKVTVTTAPPGSPVVLLVGAQHGDEPAGTEGCLRFLRDVTAETSLISKVRFVVIPSPAPDASAAYTRTTPTPSGNVDTNRDHFTLATEGAQVIQQTITDLSPIAVVDCHEYESWNPDANSVAVLTKSSKHPQADGALRTMAEAMNSALRSGLTARGIPNGPYEQSTSPTTLSNQATLRHCLSLLIETPRIRPVAERVDMYRHCFEVILNWIDANLAAAVETTAGAKQRKAMEGLARQVPFNLITEVIDPPPKGYQSLAAWPAQLTTLGIDGDADYVNMGQAAQPIIPYLLDAASPDKLTTATRVAGTVPAPAPDTDFRSGGVPLRIRAMHPEYGAMSDVETIRVGTAEGTITVWQRQ